VTRSLGCTIWPDKNLGVVLDTWLSPLFPFFPLADCMIRKIFPLEMGESLWRKLGRFGRVAAKWTTLRWFPERHQYQLKGAHLAEKLIRIESATPEWKTRNQDSRRQQSGLLAQGCSQVGRLLHNIWQLQWHGESVINNHGAESKS